MPRRRSFAVAIKSVQSFAVAALCGKWKLAKRRVIASLEFEFLPGLIRPGTWQRDVPADRRDFSSRIPRVGAISVAYSL
jgi:hypothetical protein